VIQDINNEFRRLTCPFCASRAVVLIGIIPVPPRISFSTHEINQSRSPELWRCADCQSWFKQNVLSPEQALQLYRSGESGSRWSSEEIEKLKCEEVLKTLDALVKPGMSVLDIGSSGGQLLDYFKARKCATAGVEYSIACRPILEGKGHGYFSSIEDVRGRFDVITAFDLIEHLYDVSGFFRRCSELLVDDGVLVLLTGDIGSPSARLCRGNWWYVRYPEHVVFPSTRFLRSNAGNLALRRKIRTYAAKGYRESWYRTARRAGASLLKRRYDGLPSLGPDHALMVMGRG